MANWFDSAAKAAGKTANNLGKNISKTTSGLAEAAGETASSIGKNVSHATSSVVTTVRGWLPFSNEDTLAFFAILFAVAAADQKIDEDELSFILSSPEADKLSAEEKETLQSYSHNPPSLEESIQKLSKADRELKFGLMFYILSLVWSDKNMTAEEESAIKTAQREFEINDVQVKAIEDFINVLDQTRHGQDQASIDQVKAATKRMENVGIPVQAMTHSQDSADENMEYSDEAFWDKMRAFGTKAGKSLVEQAFVMWNALHDPKTPISAKLTIAGALAYWILPVDMIPDVLPAVGFTDDLSAITAALASIAMSITPEMKTKAKAQTAALFNEQDIPESEIS
ncbi:MAG: YkvA family protein [Thainema sp.]